MSSSMEKRDQLYQHCAQKDMGTIFYQSDLASFGIADDVDMLLQICQELEREHLFQLLVWEGTTCWRIRTRDEAAKIKAMTADEQLIYNNIESSGTAGIWTKTLKAKTNLHQTTVNKALKALEIKHLVKPIRNVKYPARKLYVLSHLEPGDDVSGGFFYTDGEIDTGLVDAISEVIMYYVRRQSWAELPTPSDSQIAQKVTQVQASASTSSARDEPKFKPSLSPSGNLLVPRPVGYAYPTPKTILAFIKDSGILSTGRDLPMVDLQHHLDMLVFDGRLERIREGYRSVRDVPDLEEGTGLTRAPCGRCPVFHICEKDGPVNPSNCVYFDDWLKY